MYQQDEIIVFKQFDNSIEASIAKTKLDAYGILCFLTEENLANLYPGQNFMLFSIRLHLFANDAERATQIMDESNLVLNDTITKCPNCKSDKIERDFPKKLITTLSFILAVISFGIFFPQQKVYHCLACAHEFDAD